MKERTLRGKPFKDYSREDLELELMVQLACGTWVDLTGEEGTDPDATQSLAFGREGGGAIFILSRYEDGGDQFSLTSLKEGREEGRAVTKEQFKLQWLWDSIQEKLKAAKEAQDGEEGDLRIG